MGFLKRIHWLYLASSLVLIALGVVCVANPAFIATVICYVAGVLPEESDIAENKKRLHAFLAEP